MTAATTTVPPALWTAVYEDPLADAPRLALAEALTQAGDPRGEFITLQIRGAQDPAAVARADALLHSHRDAWLGPLVPYLARKTECAFRRGFPAAAEVYVRDDATRAAALREWATFEQIDFGYRGHVFVAEHMRALASVGPLDPAAARVLAGASRPWLIASLELGLRGPYLIEPDAFAHLAHCTTLPALRELTLNANAGDSGDCAWVWDAPFAATLERFVWHKGANPRELRAALLAARARAPRLRELRIDRPGWWRYSALGYRFETPATSADDPPLSRLVLDHSMRWQATDAVRALLALPADALRELVVTTWPDQRPTAEQLATVEALARRFPQLRTLDLTSAGRTEATSPASEKASVPAWAVPGAPPSLEHVATGVSLARFSPDGASLVFSSGPQLFVLSTHDWTLRAHVGDAQWTDLCATLWLGALAVTPDGRHCVIAEDSGETIQALALDGSSRAARGTCPPFVRRIALAPDGTLAAGWQIGTKDLGLFHLPGLELATTTKVRGGILTAAFGHDAASLFVATSDATIRRLSVRTGRFERGVAYSFATEANGSGLEASRDGRWLAAYAPGAGVRLWSLADGTSEDLVAASGEPDWSHAAVFVGDGRAVYVCSRGGVSERALDGSGRTRAIIAAPEPTRARLLAASPDGRWLALADRGLRVIDTRDGAVAWSFEWPERSPAAPA